MNRRYEDSKIDVGLVSQALNNSNKTGKYHPLGEFRSALAILSGGPMAVTKTTKLEILEAKNAAAGSAQSLADCTVTANTLVSELTITLATVLNGETDYHQRPHVHSSHGHDHGCRPGIFDLRE